MSVSAMKSKCYWKSMLWSAAYTARLLNPAVKDLLSFFLQLNTVKWSRYKTKSFLTCKITIEITHNSLPGIISFLLKNPAEMQLYVFEKMFSWLRRKQHGIGNKIKKNLHDFFSRNNERLQVVKVRFDTFDRPERNIEYKLKQQ